MIYTKSKSYPDDRKGWFFILKKINKKVIKETSAALKKSFILSQNIAPMNNQILDEAFHSEEESTYTLVAAGKGSRFVNNLIDKIAAILCSMVILGVLAGVGILDLDNEDSISNFFFYPIYLSYYLLLEYYANGKTLGKFITKTRVLTYEGEKPSFNQIVGRTLARLIPFDALSFLGSGYTGWHDSLSKTMVIDERESDMPLSNSELL